MNLAHPLDSSNKEILTLHWKPVLDSPLPQFFPKLPGAWRRRRRGSCGRSLGAKEVAEECLKARIREERHVGLRQSRNRNYRLVEVQGESEIGDVGASIARS